MLNKATFFLLSIMVIGFSVPGFASSPDILINNHTDRAFLLLNDNRPAYAISAGNTTKIDSQKVQRICGFGPNTPKSCMNMLRDSASGQSIASIFISSERGIVIVRWVTDSYSLTADPTHLDIQKK